MGVKRKRHRVGFKARVAMAARLPSSGPGNLSFFAVSARSRDHGYLGDILAVLNAEQFQRCFIAWVGSLTGVPAGVTAIDGKSVRRSSDKRAGKAPIHIVSAFAAGQRLVPGQIKVAEKSNGS